MEKGLDENALQKARLDDISTQRPAYRRAFANTRQYNHNQ